MPDQDNHQQNPNQPQGQTAQITGTVQIQPQGQGAPSQGSPQGNGKPAEQPEEKPKSGRKYIIIGVVILLVLGAGFWYWRSTFTEDTDDAQVDGDIYQISSRIQGQVLHVYVQENLPVQKGQLLLEIDPRDQQVALEQAQAALANAQAAYTQATVNVPITTTSTTTQTSNTSTDVRASTAAVAQAQKQTAAAAARVDEAKANAVKANKDVERYQPLVEKDVISKQQYDAAVAAASSANASVLEAESSLVAQETAITQAQEKLQQARNQAAEAQKTGPQQIQVQRARAEAAMAQVKQAQAQVDQAKLNLSYTRIVAPVSDGIVNKKNVDVAANLSVGQNLMNIVPLNRSLGDRQLQGDAAKGNA